MHSTLLCKRMRTGRDFTIPDQLVWKSNPQIVEQITWFILQVRRFSEAIRLSQ